jgi:hypothetical protein
MRAAAEAAYVESIGGRQTASPSQVIVQTADDSAARSDKLPQGNQVETRDTDSHGPPTPAEREKRMRQLERARRKAYLAYEYAATNLGRSLTDLKDWEAWNWLKENGIPDEIEELAGYQLPSKETFAKYVGEARAYLDERKYTRRRGRPHGKSIVRRDEIDEPKDDG